MTINGGRLHAQSPDPSGPSSQDRTRCLSDDRGQGVAALAGITFGSIAEVIVQANGRLQAPNPATGASRRQPTPHARWSAGVRPARKARVRLAVAHKD